MNIMKTNMLLLDNRIRKDDGENTATVAAPVPSTAKSQVGMKALMFQGMQNLMANPALAREVGVMNDDNAEDKTAKSAPSNVAFQGRLGNAAFAVKNGAHKMGRKFAQMVPAGMILASTMLPVLTACNDKEYISVPASEYVNNVTVNVDLSAMTALVTMMQSTLTQMLLQQKLTYEQFQQYMEQMTAWQNQVNSKLSTFEAILTDMGDNIIDINNGVQESNALQQLVIKLLTQNGMSLTQANTFLLNLINEVKDGKKTIAQAMAEIMEQLKLVNQNLDSIIANQDRAYEQQKEVIAILKDIKGNTKEAKDAAKLANMQLYAINNTIIQGNKQVVASINQLDGDMKAGIAYIAQTVGWSTQQVIAYMNKLGIDIQNSNAWNASMIIAAINYNTHVVEQGNKTLEEFKAEFEAGLITAEEYANAMLEVLNDINAKVGTLIQDFNDYASSMKKAAMIAINELRAGNITAARTNYLVTEVIKQQQKTNGILNVMNQNIEQIDVDLNAGVDALAAKLGCSTAQIISMLQWLGFSEAQISTMNAGAIINAIKNASNKEIFVLGNKLNAIIEKIGNGDSALSQEEIDEIIALLQSIDQGVDNNGSKLDELIEAVKALTAKVESYAQKALEAFNNQTTILGDIKALIKDLGSRINVLINYAKNAEEQREITNNEILNIKAQINQILEKSDPSITPEQLDAMLGKYTKKLIDELKIDIQPSDFSNIEEYLKAILAKLDEANVKLEYQAQSNKILLDILEAVKKLDKNDPDYTAKLNRIIELMENFKFECNCKCDCDDNETVHEGVIDIIG